MAFDANVYAQLVAASPEAAAQYLAQNPATPAAPSAPSTPTAPPANFQAPQPQSQYAPPAGTQATQPAQELARGTLEDFYAQPSSSNGGKGASQFFKNKPQGTWLQFSVDRDINHSDVSQLTDVNNVPQVWKFGPMAGKPKFQLVIPGTVLASSDGTHPQVFESGTLRLYLKPGPVTDSFRAALQAGGENSGFPKGGSQLVMISAGEKANKAGYSATKLYEFRYTAPSGEVASAPVEVSAPPAAPPAAVTPPAPAPAAPPAPPAAAPADVDAEKAALLAQLQGLNG